MGRLDGKVAVITGAGSGMGQAAAILFAKEGAKVVVADIVEKAGEETVKLVKEAGGEATFVKVDITEAADVKKMVDTAVKTYGKLNVICNNAGMQGDVVRTADLSEENYDKLMALNLRAVWLGMKYAIPEMIKAGGGSIVSTASVSGSMVAMKGAPHYGASKAGVVGLTRVAAMEYVTQNIRVNCVCPGPTMTPLSKEALKADPGAFKQLAAGVPMGRFAEPVEIAQAMLFLASDEASFVTGIALVADGGLTATCVVHLMD